MGDTKKEEEKKDTEKKDAEKKDVEKKEEKKKEPTFEMLQNPARVMRAQLKVVSLPESTRYTPLKDVSIGGIVLLRDGSPGDVTEIVEDVAAGGPSKPGSDDNEAEPEPPEPFEWTDE